MSLVFLNYPLETFTPTSSGALATILWECCVRARQEGIEPVLVTRASKDRPFDWPNLLPVEWEEMPTTPLGLKMARVERKLAGYRHLQYRLYVARVFQTIRKNDLVSRPLVLLNDPEMAVLLRWRFPKAHIVHWFFNQMPAKARFRSKFAQAVDVQCAVSDFTGHYVSEYYGCGSKKVNTVYIAADNAQFQPAPQPPPGLPVINFVGRTGPEKAPDLFLKAGIALAKRTKAFEMQLLGSNHWGRLEMNDYQRDLSALASELEASGITVRRPGHIDRIAMPGELRKAHIHVMPSRWDEPFALATLEGMATGLPTVASRTGGTPEAIGEDGFLFERDNLEELTEHLYCLVTDAALRSEYGQRARQKVMQFNWERTWQDLKRHAGL